MQIKDDYVRGFIAGVCGGIPSFLVNGGARLLKLNTVMWIDIMGLMIFGNFPTTMGQYIFNLVIQLTFLGILGGIFVLMLPKTSHEHIYFKGISYSTMMWFILFSLPHLLQLPKLKEINLSTAISNLVAAIAWGIGFIFVLRKLEYKA